MAVAAAAQQSASSRRLCRATATLPKPGTDEERSLPTLMKQRHRGTETCSPEKSQDNGNRFQS